MSFGQSSAWLRAVHLLRQPLRYGDNEGAAVDALDAFLWGSPTRVPIHVFVPMITKPNGERAPDGTEELDAAFQPWESVDFDAGGSVGQVAYIRVWAQPGTARSYRQYNGNVALSTANMATMAAIGGLTADFSNTNGVDGMAAVFRAAALNKQRATMAGG